MIKVIAWMICTQHMKRQLSAYFKDVKETGVLDDILTSYSHKKFKRIYKYQSLKTLFQFFITYSRDHFLSNFRGEKRDRYEDALHELIKNFKKEAK